MTSPEIIDRLQKLTPGQLALLDDDELVDIESLVTEAYQNEIDERCAKPEASFECGPLYWLTQHTKTENPKHEMQGLPYKNPFPRKSYFVPVFKAFLKFSRLFIPKSREMLTSWSAVGYCTWRAQYFHWDCILQTGSLGKVGELIDYASQLWRNQDEFLTARHPLSRKEPTAHELDFAAGGRVLAIPSGEDKIRIYHPTLLVLDEAAFLPEAQQCYDAAFPVTQQIIAISTANPGWFGEECTRSNWAAPVTRTVLRPDPAPLPEPEPKPEKSLEEQLEEKKQSFFYDQQKDAFAQRREEERVKQEALLRKRAPQWS